MRRVHAHYRTFAILLLCGAPAFSLNPSLDINQYSHYSWKISDGFSKGEITSIAQTPDGYLWLGTHFGLLRFDAIRAVPWTPPAGESLPGDLILSLFVSRDGTLWIGTANGLASWKSGKLTRFTEFAGMGINGVLQDGEGAVWASGITPGSGKLCAIRPGVVKCYELGGRFGSGAYSLREYRGDLWVGTINGLWRWNPDSPQQFPVGEDVHDLIDGQDGALWIATSGSIRRFMDGKIQGNALPGAGSHPTHFLRDREGALWIATRDRGLFHIHGGGTDQFASADGLTEDRINCLFEDREGNIWAGTASGLDRFRDFAVATVTTKQGLSGSSAGAVAGDRDGALWISAGGRLNRWHNGQMTVFRSPADTPAKAGSAQPNARKVVDSGLPSGDVESLFQDPGGRVWVTARRGIAYFEDGRFVPVRSPPRLMVHSIARDRAGDLWINDQNLGLLQRPESKRRESIPWTRLGAGDVATAMTADPGRGGLWFGFFRGGISYFQEGKIRASYTSTAGLAAGRVFDLRVDGAGALWVAAEGGVSRIQNGRIETLTPANGLPCDTAQWTMEDDSGALWLNTPCGLVSISRPEWDAWKSDPKRTVRVTVFDSSDGVRNFDNGAGYTPHVAKLADGTLWFVTLGGVAAIDPRHIRTNTVPPPVSIEQIAANGKLFVVASGATAPLPLPKLIRNLQIDYTALSFAAPEKNRFRYKLEGHDTEWIDAGSRHQAFYNDLAPRTYRFRAQACNNSGVWNQAGAFLDFSVAPAYYQTTWFLALCIAAGLAMLAMLYWLRLAQVARQFNLRLDERVNERTRIARELHDTLLQSFQGVLLKFHAVTYMIQDRPEAQKTLDAAIEEARQAIAEGRDAVQGLRSSVVITEDIARAITTLGEGLAGNGNADAPQFFVHVEGVPRNLAPVVRDEVYRIAAEGMRNAFRHSAARRIEVDIHYGRRQLQLRVRDDGKGIDPRVLDAGGREGHHGLPGMQERAQLVGGKLAIWSELKSGTELELSIPAAIAYAKSPATRRPE